MQPMWLFSQRPRERTIASNPGGASRKSLYSSTLAPVYTRPSRTSFLKPWSHGERPGDDETHPVGDKEEVLAKAGTTGLIHLPRQPHDPMDCTELDDRCKESSHVSLAVAKEETR